ncbi:hypothetical protein, partial [Knoellia sinensis]|uniref:hypothetical protein n=1 Tax=Knoellia sinensis TaxID=136100 RepID=UPI00056212F4
PSLHETRGDSVLERAVHTWEAASQAELRVRIPSTDSMRMLLNQGAHITATLETVLSVADVAGQARDDPAPLSEARKALASADKAWLQGLTSLVKPSNEFITASRELFLALEETRTRAHQLTQPEREHAAENLGLAMAIVGRRLAAARAFLQPLADGKALFAPARRLEGSPERLVGRLKGRYVPIDYFDIKDMDAALRTADAATLSAMTPSINRAQARVASLW